MPPAPFFFPSPRHAKPGKSGNFEPTRGHFSLYLMSIGCIAHGFREVPGRAHSGGVPFGNQSPRPRRCGASLACRLASRRSRRGGATGAGHAPVARTLRPSTRQAGKPTTAASAHQAPAGIIKELNYSSILCPLSTVQVRWLRPSGGRYCPTRVPWAVPPVSDPVSFQAPALPRPSSSAI